MTTGRSLFLVLAASSLLLSACGERKPVLRKYREVAVAARPHVHNHEAEAAAPEGTPPMMGGGMPAGAGDMASTPVPTAGLQLQWATPEGWIEQPGSGMRMVTFLVGPDRKECSIVSFPGDVGGVEANLRRWLGQLKATVPDDVLAKFASSPDRLQTEGGLDCMLFDFSSLLPPDAEASLLAGMVPVEGATVFVKLMGPRELLVSEKDHFAALCRSLKP